MERDFSRGQRCLEFSPKVAVKGQLEGSAGPKGTVDYSFCIQVASKEEALSIIANFSGITQRLGSHGNWRAGTLRSTAWSIVVSDGGVYVQGDLGPLHDRSNGRGVVLDRSRTRAAFLHATSKLNSYEG